MLWYSGTLGTRAVWIWKLGFRETKMAEVLRGEILIRQNSSAANDLRLRLKAEIRRRIFRIDFVFSDAGLLVYVRFVNGADRMN
jgi:hypothetical protein